MLVHALEAGDDDHMAAVQIGTHSLFVDAEDARLGEGIVGEDALGAGVALGLEAHFHQRHGQQGDGDLFAGGHQHIQFARVGLALDFLGQRDQAVGFAAHGGNHDDDLVTLGPKTGDALRDVLDALDAADRGAAVFLYDECHWQSRKN